MIRRPTLKDVASEAGVSAATVNRVVAGATGVREETAKRVAEAASRIGYHGHFFLNQRALQARPKLRVGFVLQKERQSFYRAWHEEILRAASETRDFQVTAKVAFAKTSGHDEMVHLLDQLSADCDAIGAIAVNHHAVTDAVSRLQNDGKPCYALLSDFAQGVRKSYFGTNNLKVGRGASHHLARCCAKPGKVALFVGGSRWHGHELRETGFRANFRETTGGFDVLESTMNLETRQLTHEATAALLARYPELVGIYCAGGGMEGAISALREERAPGEVQLVVNEWTPESQSALDDGYVSLIISTPLRAICRSVIDEMAATVHSPDHPPSGQVFFDPKLYLPEFF